MFTFINVMLFLRYKKRILYLSDNRKILKQKLQKILKLINDFDVGIAVSNK